MKAAELSGARVPLLRRSTGRTGEYIRIEPETAGWEHLSFAARRMAPNESWEGNTGGSEYVLVILGGICSVNSAAGNWPQLGRRDHVFAGMPYGVYLPPGVEFAVKAAGTGLEVAYGWCRATGKYPARAIAPDQVGVEIRGGGNATRQINSIVPPGFDCERLVAVEVYTPSGNWSSYPPHKHDVHRADAAGRLLEADLEETYFYKFDRAGGYAIQRVYTSDRRLDEVVVAREDDVVLVPEGYHPVAAAHGYSTYYLNFLAGSAQSLANADDPDHAWIKETWSTQDPRVPVVTIEMEGEALRSQ